jgi:hypothetical protein
MATKKRVKTEGIFAQPVVPYCTTNIFYLLPLLKMPEDAEVEDELARNLKALDIAPLGGSSSNNSSCNADDKQILILDAGYGFPREKKVRKEKINAISSQLSNFLIWQTGRTDLTTTKCQYAAVRVVGCPDEKTKNLLESRTIENMKRASSNLNENDLPTHVTISCETLEQCLEDLPTNRTGTSTTLTFSEDVGEPVYLSPDANESLDPSSEPPGIAIVGLLIDRRVQPNRSKVRAENTGIVARRWPLEDCFAEIDSHEPLNVDCVLEGMQQWWWNWKQLNDISCSNDATVDIKVKRETFIQAASQAIEHHATRHPSRPLHIAKHQ